MRSKWMKLILLTSCVILSLTGCKKKQYTKEEIYEEFQNQVSKIESYTCTADIEVSGNKGESNYIMKQSYKKPDNYRLEVISPKNLKGQTIEYKNEKIIINNLSIDDSIELSNKNEDMKYLFIGDFINNYLRNENDENLVLDVSNNYLTLETKIPGEDKYFNKQKLYVNLEDKTPDKMEIFDEEGNIRFTVKYKNFEYKK